VNKFFLEFFGFVTLWIVIIGAVIYLLNRANRPAPARRGRFSTEAEVVPCCLEQACSSECAGRQNAMYGVGAVDGARYSGRVRELITGESADPG
jgi:hypothetical protein